MAAAQIIAPIENEILARRIEAALQDEQIPHLMRSYRDSAYAGLYQNLKGWGHVEAEPVYRDRILTVVRDLSRPAGPLTD